MAESDLLQLAALAGVGTTYRDAWGNERRVAPEVLAMVLGAMGFDTASEHGIAASLRAAETERRRALLPAVVVLREGAPAIVPVSLPERLDAGRLFWSLALEDGTRFEGAADPQALDRLGAEGEGARAPSRLALPVEAPPLGYHRLAVAVGHQALETDLVMAPRRAYRPSDCDDGREDGRPWGLTVQLHSVRSARNWGIGDYGDLARLAGLVAGRGAAVVGINPLHALFPAEPRHVSPYSPSSRLFLNPLYLEVTAVPEFSECAAARERVGSPAFADALADARAAPLLDHAAVAALKEPVLRLLYADFAARHLGDGGGARSERGAEFRRFVRAGGEALQHYGRFTALHAEMWPRGTFSWRNWPNGYGDRHSRTVADFAHAHRAEIEFPLYLEWEGARQLDAAARGLAIGLYRDLAVGVDPGGADAWAEPSLFSTGASVGAPPDLLNAKGQDWGLAPLNPVMLRACAHRPFIAALRANMRHAGVLRLDHAMSLKQLYWVPRGFGPAAGAYVAYPFDELLGILALESRRNRCAVIGEDLGTVPPGFSEALNDRGVLSYRLMLFERDGMAGPFRPPRAYPCAAAAGFSTHDIATLRGFWLGTDLAWRRRLDLYPSEAAAAADAAQRATDRRLLLEALISEGLLREADAARLLPRDDAPLYDAALAEAVHRFLGRTRAALALVQAEDALGEAEQANLPGTIDAHPNWRRKLARPLEDWGHDGAFVRVLEAIDRARRRPPR